MKVSRKKALATLFIVVIATSLLLATSGNPTPGQDIYLLDWEIKDHALPAITGYTLEGQQEAIVIQPNEGYPSWLVATLTWNEDDENPPLLTTNQPDTFSISLDTPWLSTTPIESAGGKIELSIEAATTPTGTTFASKEEAEASAKTILENEKRNQPWMLTIKMVEAGPYVRPSGIPDPRVADEGNSWSLEVVLRTYAPVIKRYEGRRAPDFSTKDIEGRDFKLSDLKGKTILLEFAHICECTAERNSAQFEEIKKLVSQNPDNFAAVTVAFADTREEAVHVKDNHAMGWTFIYDFGDLPVMEKYKQYWSGRNGEFNDPTIVLIDQNFNIAAAYHITSTGAVMTSTDLQEKIDQIVSGAWVGFEGNVSQGSATFVGMFALGILTSISPCSIVLLVALLSYIISTGPETVEDKKTKITVLSSGNETMRGVYLGTMFTLGMASIFFILGLFITQAGALLANASYFYLTAGIMLIFFGINSIHPIRRYLDPLLEKTTRGKKREATSFFDRTRDASMKVFNDSPSLGAFLLGILFTLGWAPCALALIMPAVILLLAQGVGTLTGALLFLLFGIGHGIVIIPLAMATTTGRAKMAENFAKHGGTITNVFGGIIILIGLFMVLRTQGLYLW